MSSLLAYGQGFLAADIGSGAGLTEPWAQPFGLGAGDDDPVEQWADGFQPTTEEGGLSQFFSVIQAAAPKEDPKDSLKVLSRISTRKELHWDSPPQSPSTVFVHLPYAVLNIISTGTKADAIVVGVFQEGSQSNVETLLYLPKALKLADYLAFKPDLLTSINGQVTFTDHLNLPDEFTTALGGRPQAFLGHRFTMEKYNGIIFGLWRDGSCVPTTSAAVFSDAVLSLPMLLSNRINAKTYERLGRRFDAILKVMPDAVLFIDDQNSQVIVNPAAASLLGLPHHGEVDPSKVAVAMRTLTVRCGNRTDPQRWMRLLSSDEEQEIKEDWELMMPRRVLHVRSYPVTGHAAHGRLWIYEDVTAERDAEKAIEAANMSKSQFLAMMSHELRTPMTGVLGMLDLLHLTELEVEQQGLVQIMQESAEGLMDVINNILDFCKIEAGRLQLEEIDFSINDILEQIETMLQNSFHKKELKVTVRGDPCGRNVVRGDPVRLRQVLLNLVSNAMKFTEHGSVDISWRFLDPQWVDTTVVATSQASSGKSKLINQIINASRGEKCSVEHLTTESGRSVIVVNCSSAGAAGPYLESATSTARFPVQSVPFPLSQQNEKGSSSLRSTAAESSVQSSERTSFPVLYSRRSQKRPVSETFENEETIHSFTERKSIMKEPLRDSSFSDTASQSSRPLSGEDQTGPLSQKPIIKHPTAGYEEKGLQARKYQILSEEKPDNLPGISSLVVNNLQSNLSDEVLGLNKNPVWRRALEPDPSLVRYLSTVGHMPFSARDSSAAKGKYVGAGKQIMSRFQNPPNGSTLSSQGPRDDYGAAASNDTSDAELGAASGLPFDENTKDEVRKKELKPEDKVWLEVKISDTGVGIGKEQLDRLFVGSQAGSQRRNAAGTGLGLAICKGLLCLMNGKIQMDSKLGDGTTVILTVPLLPAEEAMKALIESAFLVGQLSASSKKGGCPSSVIEPPASSVVRQTANPKPPISQPAVIETEAERKKIKVLVAEDNRVNQLLIRKMFHHFGHQVEVVGNGKLAVEAVQRTDFDLVLMDIQMPILDGLSATKAIRGLPPPTSQVPIYALSADTPGSGPLEETGLDGYLKKPIVWDMMSQKVAQILAAKNEL